MKLFGYTIIKSERLEDATRRLEIHKRIFREDYVRGVQFAEKIAKLEKKIAGDKNHYSQMNILNDKVLAENIRLELYIKKLKEKIEAQENSIAKYQRVVGTNTKPKWSWEKWK